MGLFGAAVAAGIFQPFEKHAFPDLYAVMGTIMLAKILGELARIVWGLRRFYCRKFFARYVQSRRDRFTKR